MNPPARLFYDASTLIAAVGSKAGASTIILGLLTLDRKHFLIPSVLNAGFPFSTMTPGNFLRDWIKKLGV